MSHKVFQKCYHCVPIMFHIGASSVLNSLPSMSPTMSQKCPTSVPKVFHTCSKCVSQVSQLLSSVFEMRLKRIPNVFSKCFRWCPTNVAKTCQSVPFLFQACSNDVSVSNVCQWCFENFLKCAQSVANCPKLVPQVLQTCLNMCQEHFEMLPWCFKGVSTVSQTCSQRVHSSFPRVPHECSKKHLKFPVYYCFKITQAKDPKQRFLRASQLAGDRGRPAGRPGDRLERKS